MPIEWKKDLLPLQTDWKKEFLETAPYLIIVFKKSFKLDAAGPKSITFYASESCETACGFHWPLYMMQDWWLLLLRLLL